MFIVVNLSKLCSCCAKGEDLNLTPIVRDNNREICVEFYFDGSSAKLFHHRSTEQYGPPIAYETPPNITNAL